MTRESNIIGNRIDFRPGSGGTEGICCIMKLTISFWLILISPTNQESMNQRGPFAQTGKQWVPSAQMGEQWAPMICLFDAGFTNKVKDGITKINSISYGYSREFSNESRSNRN